MNQPLDEMIEEVKVIRHGDPQALVYEEPVKLEVDRSPQQKAQDDILDSAAIAAAQALASIEEAVAWLGIVVPVKNANAAHHVQKLVEEIAEVRRIRQ